MAPLTQRLTCLLQGHDWRRAIDAREGFHDRCRRCWTARRLAPSRSESRLHREHHA